MKLNQTENYSLKYQSLHPLTLNINSQSTSQEIIKYLRGSLSQRELSTKLGFSFNQVGKWESGFTQIKWNQFVDLCNFYGISFEEKFRYAFYTINTHAEFNTPNAIKAILHRLNLKQSENHFNLSIKNWLNQKTIPDLAEVIQLLSFNPPDLFCWLDLFIDCCQIPSLQIAFEKYLKNIDLVFSNPVSIYIVEALQLQEYLLAPTHDPILLSEHATCTTQQLSQSLSQLLELNLISFDGKKYYSNSHRISFAGVRNPKIRSLTQYTTQLTAERYSLQPVEKMSKKYNPSQSSVRVNAMSAEAAQKVLELIVKFHTDVEEIKKNDNAPKTNVQIILVHSFASNINASKNN